MGDWEVQVSIPLARKNWAFVRELLEEEFELYGDSGCGLGYCDISRQNLSKHRAFNILDGIEAFCRKNRISVNGKSRLSVQVGIEELQ